MKYCTPEQAGISSAAVKRFYERLDFYNLSTHSVILCRGENIFSECYFEPFHKDFLHRMYSVSKTFVSMAVGFCEQDGLLSLDDPMEKYLKEYTKQEGAIPHTTTVRELLTMESSKKGYNWFAYKASDRASTYLKEKSFKQPGTLFDYDSSGSFMLTVIVEKLVKKPFLKYLQEKVLDGIGFSKDAYCVKTPGGYSWGDSGVMCTARDLLLFARFILNGGTWGGKRYLNEEYIKDATNTRICNDEYGFRSHGSWGYGYQIWGAPEGCFAMLGMGNQIALCDPRHDFIFIINSDNQGNTHNYEQIFEVLYNNIIYNLSDDGSALPENEEQYKELQKSLENKKLFFLKEAKTSEFSKKIEAKTYYPAENPMGIKWFRLEFNEEAEKGFFYYENAQGKKCMPFGFGHNEIAQFPEEGYSDEVGNTLCPGNTYRAAFSADWPEPKKLRIRVQIIDKYFANLAIVFGFRDESNVTVRMTKKAEDFLYEYEGIMIVEEK